ncbi:MAG: heavy metal translocating P-type ATPase, partial [Betaproteobacteria bacterium]
MPVAWIRMIAVAQVPVSAATCFHCGEPLPTHGLFRARIEGDEKPVCCAGCAAVAEAIAGAGLGAYYERRSSLGRTASRPATAAEHGLGVLDSPGYQKAVVQVRPDGTREVSLMLEGVTCAACIWLIERRLQSLPGVREASVNFSNQRAYVRWDATAVRLSEIVGAIQAVGYDAEPYDPSRSDARRRKEGRASLWRLFVAGFGMMQVMMYAVPAYLAQGDMTADIEALMRWASLLLTLPVIAFSSTPFFAGAWRDLKARTVGMDVPVALGILVAFAASVQATLSGRGEVYFDSVTMFVFLLLAARHLEGMLRARAGEATERLGRLLPAFASRLKQSAQGEVSHRVAVAELVRG